MSIDIRAIPAAFAATSPVTLNFQWSGSNTTAVPAASTALQQPPADSTINVTAGSGVTALTAQIQVTQDTALASGWTTVATVNLTAPGTASQVISIPYYGVRVNVTALSGGNASATLVEGQAPTAASGGTVVQNPQLTGVAAPTSQLVAQFGVPVILPSSGSIGNNGALTLTTALPATFANCWMYFPANAIFSGSAAGVYFVQMSSTTAGTIFNNTLGSGAPYIPASPTAFSTTGPGAYTQTIATNPVLVSIPILGGALGNNGALRYKLAWITPNNANSKTETIYLASGIVLAGAGPTGTQISFTSSSSQVWVGSERTLRNQGSQAAQVSIATNTNLQTDASLNGSAAAFLTINTANTQSLLFTAFDGTATDYTILAGATVEILPAA